MPVTDMTRMTKPAKQPAVRCIQNKTLRGVMEGGRSDFRPAAQQVVVDAGELQHRRVLGLGWINPLDGSVEIEQQGALAVVSHHALDPEEGRDSDAARYWRHMMQAGRWIENHVSGRKLYV